MSVLLILCEGETEKHVLKSFLQPYTSRRFTDVEILAYDGNGDLKTNFKADAERQLKTEPSSSVICLVDLHEEPFGVVEPSMNTHDAFAAVQKFMRNSIDARYRARFGAFPVVMEPETWLLADSTVMAFLKLPVQPAPESIKRPAAWLEREIQGGYKKGSRAQTVFRKCGATRVFDDNSLTSRR
ncbi:MAG: DUF4276 family protein [Anaerolineae bacterium]|nr:DUF4276 family protein [Anaerolineae bacterium]NUQ06448.1 DUF4276 family protein [Anaerolineae bacterium]